MIKSEHSPTLGTVNKEVLDATNIAYNTAVELAESGFIVKGIMAGRKDPVVWLVRTGQCDKLESFTHKLIRNRTGKTRTRVALVGGCEIRWEEKEAV